MDKSIIFGTDDINVSTYNGKVEISMNEASTWESFTTICYCLNVEQVDKLIEMLKEARVEIYG